jgi:hypothetical protein
MLFKPDVAKISVAEKCKKIEQNSFRECTERFSFSKRFME